MLFSVISVIGAQQGEKAGEVLQAGKVKICRTSRKVFSLDYCACLMLSPPAGFRWSYFVRRKLSTSRAEPRTDGSIVTTRCRYPPASLHSVACEITSIVLSYPSTRIIGRGVCGELTIIPQSYLVISWERCRVNPATYAVIRKQREK